MVKVFISWSGEPSRSIAGALATWLGSVVQAVDPWMSDSEIRSGDRWNTEVAKALDETNFGIICVTQANQSAPWLIFEAGALAKSLGQGRVVPLCVDLAPSDITGPLAGFQGRRLNKDDMKRLVRDVSDASDKPMARERLETLFDAMWPRLESTIAEVNKRTTRRESGAADAKFQRSTDDMLSELVDRVRRLERNADMQDRGDETIAAVRELLRSGHLTLDEESQISQLLIARLRELPPT
jgi:hypothetical protein